MNVCEVGEPAARSRICERVLRGLPEWFGIEAAIAAYVRDVAALQTFAVDEDALLALKLHNPAAAEIWVMGVRRERQGRGVGTALVAAAESYLRARGVEYLHVKTLGPSHPSEHYARTRRFYQARGFVPLEELPHVWDAANPCLIMVKHLAESNEHGPKDHAAGHTK